VEARREDLWVRQGMLGTKAGYVQMRRRPDLFRERLSELGLWPDGLSGVGQL
jgi:hypothetical protein